MAGTAWNLRKYMEKLKDKLLPFIFRLVFSQHFSRPTIRTGIIKNRLSSEAIWPKAKN
jgi:hypothetical protein